MCVLVSARACSFSFISVIKLVNRAQGGVFSHTHVNMNNRQGRKEYTLVLGTRN